jgi:hypothetical protein
MKFYLLTKTNNKKKAQRGLNVNRLKQKIELN